VKTDTADFKIDHLGCKIGMKDGGYNWNAGGRIGLSGDGETYVGPMYSGGVAETTSVQHLDTTLGLKQDIINRTHSLLLDYRLGHIQASMFDRWVSNEEHEAME